MGSMIIRMKIMPKAVETNLEEIKEKVKELIESFEGKGCVFEEEPIAFGLKALIVAFMLPESAEIDPVQEGIEKIQGVNSIEVIDLRRAL